MYKLQQLNQLSVTLTRTAVCDAIPIGIACTVRTLHAFEFMCSSDGRKSEAWSCWYSHVAQIAAQAQVHRKQPEKEAHAHAPAAQLDIIPRRDKLARKELVVLEDPVQRTAAPRRHAPCQIGAHSKHGQGTVCTGRRSAHT